MNGTLAPRLARAPSVLLVCSISVLAAATAARATSPVFVDPGGICNGQAPCFTTLQAAVRNVHDPDGPGNPLVGAVSVFPGTYAESVDLFQMGADVNEIPGDIRMVTVNAAGVPTPGSVNVNPAAGPAIFIPDGEEFLGGIQLDGFNVTSPDADAIFLDEVDGPVSLANLTATNAAGAGIFVIDVNVRTNPGDLNVTNCTGSNNGDRGLDLAWLENVTVTGCTGNDNTNSGQGVGIDVRAGLNAVLTDCTANNNGPRGIEVEAAGTTTLIGCAAHDNEGIGINVVYFFASAQDTTLANCSADFNGTVGINVSHLFLGNGDVIMSACSADENGDSGISILADLNATLTDCSADENVANGILVTNGARGDVSFTRCSADDNTDDGMVATSAINAVIDTCTAARNGNRGIVLSFATMNALLQDCTAIDNADSGMLASADGIMTALRCQAHRNVLAGMSIRGNQGAVVRECAANQNVAALLQQILFGGNGIVASSLAATEVTDCVANDNDSNGMNVSGETAVDILRCTTNDNGRPGVIAGGIGIDVFVGADVTISHVTTRSNLRDGILIGFEAEGLTQLEEVQDLAILDSLIRGNGRHGINIAVADPTLGDKSVAGSIICENEESGLSMLVDTPMVAEGNWWGSQSGPTHPTNAAGLGDAILDGANGGAGTVDLDPFIETVTPTVSVNPVNAGQATVVSFQFAGGGGAVFLGQGPGDLNGTPTFTLTTDNGVLTSSTAAAATVEEFINNANGVLSVTLVPAVSGTANVALQDFCNLTGNTHVGVTEADLSVTKTDNQDPIVSVHPLIYTLTVENAGPQDATDVTLVDMLPASVAFDALSTSQGSCAETAGIVTCDLGSIPAGGSALVTIAVFGTAFGQVTNTATVSGDEDDPDLANNTATEDTFVVTPTGQSPPVDGGASSDDGDENCGAGMCGFGSLGVMPLMLAGLASMKRRAASTGRPGRG
jgi:uncharacterized repeat protein (TIGR01451 family)